MWYRFAKLIFAAVRDDLLFMLNNDEALLGRVNNITTNNKLKYLAAKYLNKTLTDEQEIANSDYELKEKINKFLLPEYKRFLDGINVTRNNQSYKTIDINGNTVTKDFPDDMLGFNTIVDALGATKRKKVTKFDPTQSAGTLQIYDINSPEDGMKFASLPFPGTPWCITWEINNQWYNYRMNYQATFYIIIDNSIPEDNNFHAVALDHNEDGIFITTFNNPSEESAEIPLSQFGGQSYLEYLQSKHGISESRFQHKELSQEERDLYEAIKDPIESTEQFKNLNDQFDDGILKYIQFNSLTPHDLTDDQFDFLLENYLNKTNTEWLQAYVKNSTILSNKQYKKLVDLNLKELLSNNNYKENKMIQNEKFAGNFNESFLEKCKKSQSDWYYGRMFEIELGKAVSEENFEKVKELTEMDNNILPNIKYSGSNVFQIKSFKMYNFLKSSGVELTPATFGLTLEISMASGSGSSGMDLFQRMNIDDFMEGFMSLFANNRRPFISKEWRKILEERIQEFKSKYETETNSTLSEENFDKAIEFFEINKLQSAIKLFDFEYIEKAKSENKLNIGEFLYEIPNEEMFNFLKDIGFDMNQMYLRGGFGEKQLYSLKESCAQRSDLALKKLLDLGYRSKNFHETTKLIPSTWRQVLVLADYPSQVEFTEEIGGILIGGVFELKNLFEEATKKSENDKENLAKLQILRELMTYYHKSEKIRSLLKRIHYEPHLVKNPEAMEFLSAQGFKFGSHGIILEQSVEREILMAVEENNLDHLKLILSLFDKEAVERIPRHFDSIIREKLERILSELNLN